MSLIASCKLLEVDTYQYVRDLLEQLPRQRLADAALADLLPDI